VNVPVFSQDSLQLMIPKANLQQNTFRSQIDFWRKMKVRIQLRLLLMQTQGLQQKEASDSLKVLKIVLENLLRWRSV